MGYRLDINIKNGNETKNLFYGTKLYGYCDEMLLSSYKYLIEINKFDGSEYFGYGATNEIELNYIEYITFICLYNQDLNNYGKYNEKDSFIKDNDIINSILNRHETYLIDWI